MNVSSHDMPPTGPGATAELRTLEDRHNRSPKLSMPPPAAEPEPPMSAETWLGQRIAVADDFIPGSQHLAWLAAQRAITACERAQQAADTGHLEAVAPYLAAADQYRQIAQVCSERAGLTAPQSPDAKQRP
jgi:hypothetical protein